MADAAQRTEELLARLVGFDTTSHKSNLDLVAFVEEYLGRHGVPCTRIPDDDGAKTNLLATIGPADRPGVVLSGHTDVVPVTGQQWTSDPFALTERHADGARPPSARRSDARRVEKEWGSTGRLRATQSK